MNKLKLMALILISTALLVGCTPSYFYYNETVKDDNLVDVSYEAVNHLLLNLKTPLPKGSLIVINSLVNVDDMGQTLPFGRIVSDQLSSALHQSGYRVMGMELPTEIFAKNEAGILEIPEKTKTALNEVQASAVVVGTYAAGRKNVYVSLRIVELSTENVISSTDYSIPMGPDAKRLATVQTDKE
ncbi:MAG: FlgO family outer membrane protein [Gammaproteobacteria bacterium]